MRGLVLTAALGWAGALAAQIPVTQIPVAQIPVTQIPVTQIPVTQIPVTQTLSTDAGVAAAQAWIGRALILRGAYLGGELEFDSAGRVKGSPKTTDWTLAGVDLAIVTRRPTGELQLDGARVAISYNQGGHVFERHPQKDQKLRVLIPAASEPGKVDAELAAIFSQGIDPALERSLPAYWSHYFLPQLPWPDDDLKGVAVVGASGKVPAEIVMPVPEKSPEPERTEEARSARIQGTVQAMVAVDPEGMPQRVVLRNPLGWGLDAKVAETVMRYRFRPGSLGGKVVAVEVVINQRFVQ